MISVGKHLAQVVFGAIVALSLLALGLLMVVGKAGAWVAAVGVLLCLWSMWQSDHRGFVRATEMRRAYEPSRHFSMLQTFAVMALAMLQMGVATFTLLDS